MSETQALQVLAKSIVLSKEVQEQMANDLVAQVIDGDVDPIQAFVQMKAMYETAEKFLKNPQIVNAVQAAAAERGKQAVFAGAKVSLANTTNFDYSMCGDREYDDLKRQEEDLKAKIKARQLFLKSIPDRVDVVDRNTGELTTVVSPLQTKSSSLRVTFAK